MKCPYCDEEMIEGFVYGDRYALKWLPENKELLFGLWAKDGIKIGSGGASFERPRVKADMCQSCKKILIDINESNVI